MIPSFPLERLDPLSRQFVSLLVFHYRYQYFTHSSDEVIPPSQPTPPPPPERRITPVPQSVAAPPPERKVTPVPQPIIAQPPERKITPAAQPVAAAPPSATIPSPSLTRSLYKSLRSAIKPSSTSSKKKLTHAQSTPDISAILADNKKDDDDTSSSLENLSNTYSTMNSSQPRPAGSILKRTPQPKQIHEEPVYVSSAGVPLQKSPVRSVQSMIQDQNTKNPARYFG